MRSLFSTRGLAALAALLANPSVATSTLQGERVASRAALGFHDTVSSHVVPMRGHPISQSHDVHLRRRGNVSTSLTNVRDIYYIIDLLVGNQTIPVSVDTGSSDTWMVQEPYECVTFRFDPPGRKPNCGLGSGFKGNLSGGNIPNVGFGRAYGDGTFVQGFFGYEDVSIGGLMAKHQRIAIVNYTYWFGDGLTSGLLGLAYPYMTSLDGPFENQPLYDPVFTTLWKDKLISPLFSIALSREARALATLPAPPATPQINETSFLALGGLPNVSFDNKSWARTPIQNMSAVRQWGLETEERGLYVITAENYLYGKPSLAESELVKNTTQFPVLIDAGSTLSILPRVLTENLYKAFDPPAVYLSSTGLFYAVCNATVPKFGITFGGHTFYIAPEDLLSQRARDPTKEYCRIGITDSDSSVSILGVTFLTNVLAVFDIEHNEMRFAQRTKY